MTSTMIRSISITALTWLTVAVNASINPILSPTPTKGEDAAINVLQRTIGESQAAKFVLHLAPADGKNDWFETKVAANQIHITGNSPVALCKGAYAYIKDNGYGLVTWEAVNVDIPHQLADREYSRVSVSVPLRMYLNPVTYGYSTPWWDWPRWEREIDWMALHGINMPLALLGQEIIWQQVWRDIGITTDQLAGYHTGPAFLPWFRMGNIYNHFGPLPASWMVREQSMQKQILKRMRELGMQPVLPAFSGHVPPQFSALYPDSTTYRLENWGGLETDKASLLLDPKDPLFTKIGKLFLEKYEQIYGPGKLFLADAFNEMLPPVSTENKHQELSEYGAAIYNSIAQYDRQATWVIQGWTFGHQGHFWDAESTQAFFDQVPQDNLLFLNYGEDRYSIWERLNAFYGYKWTYGYVHNYGGQQALFGDLGFYHQTYQRLFNHPNRGNLVGYGVLPESIENNAIVYEHIFDIPWEATDNPLEQWVTKYLTNRYGQITPDIKQAWEIALDNTYAVKEWRGVAASPIANWINDNLFNRYSWTKEWAIAIYQFFASFNTAEDEQKSQPVGLGYGTYIHNNRPHLLDIEVEHYLGNPETIRDVVRLLRSGQTLLGDSHLLFYDIVDFTQHFVAYQADLSLVEASHNYQNGDMTAGDAAFDAFKIWTRDLEALQILTGGSFTEWCNNAIRHATSAQERQLYLRNAKAQLTVWGGDRLKDYASKSWAGLLSDFYVPRWEYFFAFFKSATGEFDPAAAERAMIAWEQEWVMDRQIPAQAKPLSRAQVLSLIDDVFSRKKIRP